MRFVYRYQDREKGVLDGEVSAPSKAEAYSVLRKSGIHPMSVDVKPGFLNRVSAIGRRGTAIVILSVVVIALLVVLSTRQDGASAAPAGAASGASAVLPRHQFPDVEVSFRFDSERTLARFARPGDMRGISENWAEALSLDDIESALAAPLAILPEDSPNASILKKVVNGLKSEVSIALSTGETKGEILSWLVERQRMEEAYRSGIVSEAKSHGLVTNEAARSEVNAALRSMRLREIGENDFLP